VPSVLRLVMERWAKWRIAQVASPLPIRSQVVASSGHQPVSIDHQGELRPSMSRAATVVAQGAGHDR
jgi:hypothetical protein